MCYFIYKCFYFLMNSKAFYTHIKIQRNMAQNKVSMPSSTAGITRFFDEYKSKITLKPGTVIFLAILVMIIEIILYLYGYKILGIQ